MKYVLFIGSKLGFKMLNLMTDIGCEIIHVFIEMEHDHEHEKFYHRSIEICEKRKIKYTIDSSYSEIESVLENNKKNDISVDYIMSFGYRRMISNSVLSIPKIAALGSHFSPLPRYRGFAPLNWLLINGESQTAVNLFYLDKEVDNGNIIDREIVPIDYNDDINTLFDKCIINFEKVMKRAIPKLENGKFESIKQDVEKATYTCARNPEDGRINWENSSYKIYNIIRALTYPYPGAYSYINGKKFVIWTCEEYKIPKYEGRISGKVIKIFKDKGVVVLCGEGAVLLKDIQAEDGERQTADKLIKSVRTTLGF